MAIALAFLGRMDEAKVAIGRMLEITPNYTLARVSNLSPFKDPEFRKQTTELLRAAGVPD